jgi:hypothetical protein
MNGKIYNKIFPLKSISGVTFYFGNLATDHFSGKFFSKFSALGHTGSNDNGLMSLSCPGAEPIDCQTNKHTFECYNIDNYSYYKKVI